MRSNSYPLIFLSLLINLSIVASCKKEKAPERLASGEIPLLEKITGRFRDIDGSIKTYTEVIEYDDEGRVTSLKDEQGRIYTAVEYAGEVIRRRVEYRLDGSVSNDVENFMTLSDNGDTVFMVFTYPTSFGMDSLTETYIFNDSVLTELRQFITKADPRFPDFDLRYHYVYDSYGNFRQEYYTINGIKEILVEVLDYDNQPNFVRYFSRTNFLILRDVFNLSRQGLNNATRMDFGSRGGGVKEFEYTYTPEGYISTAKRKDESFLAYELTYKN